MADAQAIIRQIQIAKRFGAARKPRKIAARPRYPYVLERTYQRQLREYINVYIKVVKKVLISRLPELVKEANSLRPDGMHTDNWVSDLAELINAITFTFGPQEEKIKTSIKVMSEKVNDFNKEDIDRTFRSVLGVNIFTQEPWLRDQLDSFIAQNEYIIKGTTQKATNEIRTIAQQGLANGDTAQVIGDKIKNQFGITQRRAELIARDQVASFNGTLTKLRQTAIGVKQYIWRTSLDERVRPSHEAREGNTYDWDYVFTEDKIDGPPGTPILCRCVAEPVLDDILEAI